VAEATKVGSIFYESSINTSGVKRGAQEIQKEIKGLKSGFEGLGTPIKAIGVAFATYIGARAVLNFFKDSVRAANEANQVMTQTEAVIRSTGGAAGYTSQEISDMASQIQRTTAIGDEAAQMGMNMLLTFTKIGKEVFPDATQALIDMATAMNGGATPSGDELRQTAIQLGKALNDPILGMTALRRVGVNFNETQAEMVKKMVDSGHQLEAQKFMLRELANEFGGSAAAQARTFQGQVTQLSNAFDDLKEELGRALIPTLGYLVQSLAGLGGAFNVLLFPIRLVSSALLGVILVAREVGIALSTIAAAVISLFRGEFNIIGDIVKQGMTDMLLEGADAQEKLTMIWGQETEKQTGAVLNALDDQEDATAESAKKIAKSLADETEKFEDEMAKRKKTFEENLADLIFSHLDKVDSLKDDLSEENKDFEESMAERVKEFKESMAEIKKEHKEKVDDIKKDLTELNDEFKRSNEESREDAEDQIAKETKAYEKKVTDIQAQIDKETAKGKNASQTRLRILRQSLADEKQEYSDKVDSVNSDLEKELEKALYVHQKKQTDLEEKLIKENQSYDESVLKAKERDKSETERLRVEHEERISDLQSNLSSEESILKSHQSEVDKVKNKAREDDVARLIRQYNEENIESDKQHQKRMSNIRDQGATEGNQLVNSFNNALVSGSGKIQSTGSQIGSSLASSIGNTGRNQAEGEARSIVDRFVDSIRNKWSGINWKDTLRIGWPFSSILSFMGIPFFQEGVKNFGGGLAVVGEKGPELVHLPAGADVIPNEVAFDDGRTGSRQFTQTIHINIEKVASMTDVQSIGRELGFRASLMPEL
jgi:hypothetical protein